MTDVIIIGGGVIGLRIARELSSFGKETIVLEKNERAGDVTSSRNSGVIHAGIYYPKNFLKTKLCVEGNKLIYEYNFKSFYLILSAFLSLVFYLFFSLFIKAFKYDDIKLKY